jgi:hypothetical protein
MGQIVFYGKELKPNVSGTCDNRRAIHLFMDKGMHKPCCGIYKLSLGDHFYIGRAEHIRKRAKQHMKDMEYMIHYKKEKPGGQKNMLKYLLDHPECDRITIQILEICRPSELNEREQHWVNVHIQDPKLLNIQTKVTKTIKDSHRQQFSNFMAGRFSIDFIATTDEEYMTLKKLEQHPQAIKGTLIKKT